MGDDVPVDALVIRGSDPHAPGSEQRMYDQAKLAHDKKRGYSLSTGAGHGPLLSREELIRQILAAHPIPNKLIAVARAGELMSRGLVLRPDGPLPAHTSVILGEELTLDSVRRFVEAFGPAEDNPTWRERRRP
jgi:hypothetical protein